MKNSKNVNGINIGDIVIIINEINRHFMEIGMVKSFDQEYNEEIWVMVKSNKWISAFPIEDLQVIKTNK